MNEPDKGYSVAAQQIQQTLTERLNRQAPLTDVTSALLAKRGKTHGDFAVHAQATQGLKRQFYGALAGKLTDVQAEAVDMILHKLGRIAAGDPGFKDHWDDIAGYARLVADRCVS